LPQVAADYRINTYFRDASGVYVNLYIPSKVRWAHNGSQVSLSQSGGYPFDPHTQFEVTASRPVEFAIHLRIPAWAEGATVSVNGKRLATPIVPGSFASVHREWRTGDKIDLELPLKTRLEPIDTQHSDTVALLAGPLVLFAITDGADKFTRGQLLAVKLPSIRRWQVETPNRTVEFLPFTMIEDEQYSTYVRLG
jgi:DUF1680 family protein